MRWKSNTTQTGRLRTFEFCKCGIQVQQIESQLTLYPHCKELCWCASISIDIENQGKTKHQYFLFLFIELRNISLMQLLQRQGWKVTKSHTAAKEILQGMDFLHCILITWSQCRKSKACIIFFLNFQKAVARNVLVWKVLLKRLAYFPLRRYHFLFRMHNRWKHTRTRVD